MEGPRMSEKTKAKQARNKTYSSSGRPAPRTKFEPHDVLTAVEVARVLQVSPQTLTTWAKNGVIPQALRTPTGLLRWRYSELVDWMNGLERAKHGSRPYDGPRMVKKRGNDPEYKGPVEYEEGTEDE
jgi:predicted DNA-binding transcriptional regulator AlpA